MIHHGLRVRTQMREQLQQFFATEVGRTQGAPGQIEHIEIRHDRLALAGFLTTKSRQAFYAATGAIGILLFCCLFAALILTKASFAVLCLVLVVVLYSALCALLLYLRSRKNWFERQILYYLPLTLEQLLLLVQAGVGIIPAIHQLLLHREENPVLHFLGSIYYKAERGMLFESAIAEVAEQCPYPALRHFLLHLETAVSQGAELSSVLRNLSDHAHAEWQVTLEGAVRKLESAVVFPVFIAVFGLMMLVAAVPLVPIMELSRTMKPSTVTSPVGVPILPESGVR